MTRIKHIGMVLGLLFAVGGVNLLIPLQAVAAHIQPVYRYTTIPEMTATSTFPYGQATYGDVNYTSGSFNGTVNFAGASGNDTITSSVVTAYLTKHNNDGSYDWTRIFDTTSNGGGSAEAQAVATDPSGNVYITGSFSGAVTFDGPGGTDSQNITGGGTFITKYSAAGSYLGTKTIIPPPNGQAVANGIAIDGSGNVYVSGSFNDTVNFAATDGGTDNQTDAGGNGDAFVTRFNADGSYGWTKTFDTTSGGGAYNVYVAVDSQNDLYLTGNYYGSVNFAGTSGNDTLTDPNGDVFITKLTTAGSYGWTKTFVNSNSSYAGSYGIATDPAGNVYVTGAFGSSVNFAGANGNDTQTDTGGSSDTFLTKYTSQGNYAGTKTFDTSPGGSAWGQAVTTDMNGDVYILSALNGAVNFAGTSGNDTLNESGSGAVTMYEPDGTYAWTRTFDTTNGSAVTTQGVYAGLATDTTGNLYISSIFGGTVGFDEPGGNDSQTTNGYESAFLTSYKTFVPIVTTPVSAAGVTATTSATQTLAIPDTGFGISRHTDFTALYLVLGAATMAALCRLSALRPAKQ